MDSPVLANALYDILVKELRARESTRWDFCTQYQMGAKEIPVYYAARYRSDARAWFNRRPDHLGDVMANYNMQGAVWANQAIVALENQLARMSPLERIDWFNQESRVS